MLHSNGVRGGMQYEVKRTVASDVDFPRPGCVRETGKAQKCWFLLLGFFCLVGVLGFLFVLLQKQQ